MFYEKNGIEISFTCIETDLHTIGVRVETDKLGNINFFDDPTNSYLTWDLDYDQIFDELYECWLKRIKAKKYTQEAFYFERNVGKQLDRQTKKILNLSWKPKGYFDFQVYHPTRTISAPYYEDRIVEEWLTERFVKPYVEQKVHYYNVACQKDKGPPVAQKFLKDILKKLHELYGNDFYFLQYDIQGYYDNVSHDKIKEQFSGMQAIGYQLFCNIIDDWTQSNGYAAEADPEHRYGIPKGNLPSQWTGILYLNDIDWYLDGRLDCLGNVRYMDDGIAFFRLKSSCKDCKIQIEKYLRENNMGVRLHPRKTVYAPITRGFTFCGFRYTVRETGNIWMRVKPERKKLTKEKFERIAEKYYLGELSYADVCAKINGTYAFLDQGTNRGFKRYLVNRYRFTHDPDKHYKKIPPPQKKKRNDSKLMEENTYEEENIDT